MSFSLTVLGSSSALPTSKRFPSAHVLKIHEHFFLIDCGEGAQIQLRKFKIKLGRINHIFISHLHGDHIFGIPGLLSTFSLLGRRTTLFLHGHQELQYIIDFFKTYFGKDLQYEIKLVPFKANKQAQIFENKHITVETLPLRHRIPTVGFLFKEKKKTRNIKKEAIKNYNIPIKDIIKIKNGEDFITQEGIIIPNTELTLSPYRSRSFAYCTDTLYHNKLAERIKGTDLLYHEATFLECDKKLAKQTFHSTAAQAAKIAQMANVKKLILGHFSSRYKNIELFEKEAKVIFPDTEAVEDGKEYSIDLKRTDT